MQLYRTTAYTDDERRRAFALACVCVCVYVERVELTCYPWWICNEQSRCVRVAVRWVVCQPPLSDRSGARRIRPRKQQETRTDDNTKASRRRRSHVRDRTPFPKCNRLNNRKRNENKRGKYIRKEKKDEEKRLQKRQVFSSSEHYIDDKR